MYGQMTAGSWIYIGTQGILQGTYETFGALAKLKGWDSLKGKFVLTAGLGGMGGAQPLAAVMAGATYLGADINKASIQKRLDTKYIDFLFDTYEAARDKALEAKANGEAISIGVVMDAGDLLQRLLDDNIIPDILSDQTSAHDPLNGYVPHDITFEEALVLRKSNPTLYTEKAIKSMARHVQLMLTHQQRGAITFD